MTENINQSLSHEKDTTQSINGFTAVIVDADGSIVKQNEFIEKHQPKIISLRHKTEELRYWTTFETLDWLKQLFVAEAGSLSGKVIFYGSGDYHHLAYAWLSLLDEPVTLIHFDNHTDLLKSGLGSKIVQAGGWAANALRLPQIRKTVQLGVDGDLDVNASVFLTGTPLPIGSSVLEIEGLGNGKLEVYPTAMQCSTLFGKFQADSPCAKFTPGLITTAVNWKNIRRHGIENILDDVLERIPTEAVYLTIDKDALREADSFTNYYTTTQGELRLDELLSAISIIKRRKRIVAVDVCGDGSYPILSAFSAKHSFFLLKDRNIPRTAFTSPEMVRLNETANLKIMTCLNESI